MYEEMKIKEVRDQYAGVARGTLSNESAAVRSIATAFGYAEADLNALPPEANMGLSCGNPLALAGIRDGETILDLGCGGGIDVFLAARRVGASGRVIGIDMTAEMLERARAGQQKLGLTNVEFHQATIDCLPLSANSVDCVISNCVINLAPDKRGVFREILRVLKPGGRIAISDIALKQELPTTIKQSTAAYVGCIAGAILIDEYRKLLEQAGFTSVMVTDTGADLNAYALASEDGCCSGGPVRSESGGNQSASPKGSLHSELSGLMRSFDANAYAASVRIMALKSSISSVSDLAPSTQNHPSFKESNVKTVEIFDKPMCCSTGVCGPEVDPVLPQFAADLDWLKKQGHRVERYNLAQQPQAFLTNKSIHQILSTEGTETLPVIIIDGQIVSRRVYPTREALAAWIQGTPPQTVLPVVPASGGSCGTKGCC